MTMKAVSPTERRAWEQQSDWTNPFDESSASQSDRKKKKKKKRSKKRYTEEELSQTDTLLDELLSFEDEDNIAGSKKMSPVNEDFADDDSMGVVKDGSVVANEKGLNPFEDPEEEEEEYGNEYDKQGFDALLNRSPSQEQQYQQQSKVSSQKKNINPFEEEEQEKTQEGNTNPFKVDNEEDAQQKNEMVAQANSNPFDDSDDDVYVEEERPTEELDEDSSVDSADDAHNGHNPFDDETEVDDGAEFDDGASIIAQDDDDKEVANGHNPFEDDSSDTDADDEASMSDSDDDSDDDSILEPPGPVLTAFEDARAKANALLGFDTKGKKKTPTAGEQADETEKTTSTSFDSAEQIEAVKTETGGVETRFVIVKQSSYEGVVSAASMNPAEDGELKRNVTDETSQGSASDDESAVSSDSSAASERGSGAAESEEDVVESSKRLLRMVDQRMQYQQHNDEMKELKNQLQTMKIQAEAMSEQLRRAVETKCDLVLAQTEMERCHEQDLICRDDEMRDMKLYVQEILEKGALNELNFMNEIATLSKSIQDMKENHRAELREKDFLIAQLGMKLNGSRKVVSARGPSNSAFKSRFLEKIEETSECGSVSTTGTSRDTGVVCA